jgi:aspartate/methionine/tyrosine aminotransferase
MPRHPRFAPSVAGMEGSPYSALAGRLASFPGETYPLHVGDTWMEPPEGARMEDLRVADHPGMHRYTAPHGLAPLVAAVAERVTARSGLPTSGDEVLITGGATGGLGAVLGALLAPGDEVLILAPYWPLIEGIVRSFHGRPVAVPFFGSARELDATSPEEAVEILRRHATERTVALYFNTPSNPSGRVLPRRLVEALVSWAAGEGLWVIADEVYEDYVYRGEHAPARRYAPERTFAAHSFSKAYGMAGNRVGYVVGPAAAMAEVRKVGVHSFYCAPTAGQLAALACLEGRGDAWVAAAREQYGATGEAAARRLGVEPPDGSTFLFVDVAEAVGAVDAGLGGLLERAVDRGLFVAPGASFGPYPTHLRLCFTAAPPEVTLRGVEVLAQLLGR